MRPPPREEGRIINKRIHEVRLLNYNFQIGLVDSYLQIYNAVVLHGAYFAFSGHVLHKHRSASLFLNVLPVIGEYLSTR